MNIADIRDKLKTIAERTTSSGIRTVTPNVGDPVKTTTSGNVGDPVQTGLIDTGDSEYDDAVVDPIKANRDQADKIFKQAQAQIAATKAAQRGGEQPEQNLPYKDPRKEAELQRTIAQMQGNLGDAEAWSKEVAQQEIENSAKMAARAQELADMGIDVNQQLPKQVKDPETGEMVDLDADDLEVRLNYLSMQKGLPMLDLGFKGQSGELSSEFGRDFQRKRIATRQRELDRLGLTDFEIEFIRKARSGDKGAISRIRDKRLLDKDPETGEYLMYKTIKPGQDPAYAL